MFILKRNSSKLNKVTIPLSAWSDVTAKKDIRQLCGSAKVDVRLKFCAEYKGADNTTGLTVLL